MSTSRCSYLLLLVGLFLGIFSDGVRAGKIDFSDCGSDYSILSVELEGCDLIPCKLQLGKSYKIVMNLKPNYKSSYLTQNVYVELFGINFDLAVTPDNPCASLVCPISVIESTKFTGTITVPKDLYPKKGMLWWKMKTEKGATAVCMKTSVEIVKRPYTLSKLVLY